MYHIRTIITAQYQPITHYTRFNFTTLDSRFGQQFLREKIVKPKHFFQNVEEIATVPIRH